MVAAETVPTACSDVRRALGESLPGTAPEAARSWLLVEHPGPWPSPQWPDDLPPEAADVLARASELGIRPQLVRRVSDRRREDTTVMAASCRPGASWLERRAVRDLRALAGLDLEALADGTPPGFGTRSPDPVVLVCTHGRRDVCCARRGRPLAVLLDAQLPGQVWETTHVGGDRFSPNVVTLPDGSYHGGLDLVDVPALAEAVTSDRLLLSAFRGRAGTPRAAQAAEHHLRRLLQADALGAVTVVATTPAPDGEVCVEALLGGERWCVHVRAEAVEVERRTSCGADLLDRPPSFRVTGARRLA